MALTTQQHLDRFATLLRQKMALETPRSDAEIDAQYGADDQPETEN